MTPGPFQPYAEDLAPGDQGALDTSWPSLEVAHVRSADDPLFEKAYDRLWREFGERGEMERRDVLRDRLAWNPERPIDGHAMQYELLLLRHEGQMVAVRDHTVIVPRDGDFGTPSAVVVHLSHVLVEPEMRGRGLAAWLRTLPIAAAKRCVEQLREPGARSMPAGSADVLPGMTLVAEMEHDDGATPDVRRRLRSYARAGFRVIDPHRVSYCQPDFRTAEEIDRTGERPVPLCLVVRRVGLEHENSIAANEARRIVDALHGMYGVHVRPEHMRKVREIAASMPPASGAISLLVPGLAPPEDRQILK